MNFATTIYQEASTNLTLDAKSFLENSVKDMRESYDYAYPNTYFDEDRAHAALQRIEAQLSVLESFLLALK